MFRFTYGTQAFIDFASKLDNYSEVKIDIDNDGNLILTAENTGRFKRQEEIFVAFPFDIPQNKEDTKSIPNLRSMDIASKYGHNALRYLVDNAVCPDCGTAVDRLFSPSKLVITADCYGCGLRFVDSYKNTLISA